MNLFSVVDIETTGGSPKTSKITEIAIYKTDGNKILDEFETLVNPERSIDSFVVRLTGINDQMVQSAPKFYEIAKKIIEFTHDTIFVAHNVSFDYGIIREEFKQLGFDFRLPHLCTVRASKIVIPGYESYSLGKITSDLNIELNGRHRAGGDALATTKLFQILFNKDKNQLATFVSQEINPKLLHPNLNLESFDSLPNKTGVYKLYDETKKLIYIGKSKHIKKRIEQHLKNNKTKKGELMRQEICFIEYELTGSEMIALLLEAHLVKQYKPIYNRMLRRDKFPVGLFSYSDLNGYIHLFIDKVNQKNQDPITTFGSKNEAVTFLSQQCEVNMLCQKLCHLYKSSSSCFAFELKQCFGACIEKEKAITYNARVNQFINKLSLDENSFYLLDKGITSKEKTIVLVENGTFRGFGQIPFYALKRNKITWKEFVDYYPDDKDARQIILQYLRKKESVEVVRLD